MKIATASKIFPALLAFTLMRASAFAGTIDMAPGSTITVNANEVTTVSCPNYQVSAPTLLNCYCNLVATSSGYFNLIAVYMRSDGVTQDTMLGNYQYFNTCQSAITSIAACTPPEPAGK